MVDVQVFQEQNSTRHNFVIVSMTGVSFVCFYGRGVVGCNRHPSRKGKRSAIFRLTRWLTRSNSSRALPRPSSCKHIKYLAVYSSLLGRTSYLPE